VKSLPSDVDAHIEDLLRRAGAGREVRVHG